MSSPVLTRFDHTFYRNQSVANRAQVPWSGATVTFYLQGATVAADQEVAHGQTTEVSVYDPGALRAGDVVRLGLNGPTFSVHSTPEPRQFPGPTVVALDNAGPTVTVHQGDRLMVLSRRPSVYSDPAGTEALGSTVRAGDDGRLVVYVAEPRFDYVTGATVDVCSSATLDYDGIETVLSWNHTPGSDPDPTGVLVAISWSAIEGASLDQVTYGGVSMTPLNSAGNMALFKLDDPGTGTKQIVASFSDPVSAVGGAATMVGSVDDLDFVTNSGNSVNPSITLPYAPADSLLFGALTLGPLQSSPGCTPASGQTTLWNRSSGASVPITRSAAAVKETACGGATTLA